MINVSDTFKQKLQDGERVWQEVEITFPGGTVKTVKNEIMGENCTFSDCAESSSFPIGCVVCKSMTLELDNTSDQWKNYNFYMAKVHAYLKMQTSVASPAATDELLDENYDPILDQSGGAILATKAATEDRVETIDKGIYTITTPEQYGEILSFTALDDMYKTNATYISHLVLPQSIETLVRDACETLGIPPEVSMAHGNLIVSEIPENMTFRQLFGWAAMLETANARLDNRGYLQFVKWDFSAKPIELKDYIDTPTVSSDDIVITGIKVKSGDNSELYGESGYVIELENNLVGEADLATVAAQIGDAIIGVKFRNLQGDMAFNPLLEFGDMATTYDRNVNKYLTPLTDVSYAINGKTTVKTQADDPIRGMSKFVSDGTKAIVEARRLVKIEKTEREKAVERLAGILASSGGLYMTEEPQEDGSTIYYMHNKPTLKESDIIWKLTAEAFAVSIDGGKTYPYGFAVTGELITRLLYAEGINATYINTGALIVKDKNEKVIFEVDMDKKSVYMDPDTLTIGGMPLSKKLASMDENIASAKNMTFQLSNDMQTITSDADGNIPVFPTVATTAKVMYGSSDITNDCSYTITKSDSVTGSWDVDTHTYTVTGLSADNGWVDIKATYLINLSITKRFTISKQKSGKNGKQLYTWRKYASMPDGSDMSDSPDYVKLLDSAESPILDSTGDEIYTVTEAIYVGIADNKTTETPSDNPKDYIWSRFRGEDGADGIGIPGENGETSYIHTAYANSIDGTVDFSTTNTDRIYIGHYSDFEKADSADPAKYTWARMRGEDGPPGRTYYLRANAGVLMMGQDKKITPNPFNVHAYYRDGQGDEATFKTWWIVEYSKDAGKTWTKMAFNSQTSGITINPDSYSLSADGMIRATIYTDSGRTKIADQQTWQVAVDVGMLTQEQIVEILSNGGEFKGLYYLNGHLYISLDALMGNAAILGGTKNGNGYLKIKDKKGTVKGLIDYSGYTAFTSYEENSTRMKYTGICFSDTGINPVSAEKYFSSTADIEYVETAWGIDWTAEELNISATEVSADTGTFGDLTVTNSASFTKSPKIEDMEYTTSSNTICWDGRTGYKQLMLKSSSSKRYKDIGNDISEQEIEEWYNIKPLWAKYKEGYLVKGDENEGRYIPMFIAENVEAFFPEATRHQNGLVEDWNERIMIPAMFAMIKSQKEQLDRQEKLINQLYKKLNIEKEI
uniref:Tail protein n=1 Tax=Siphoviridae sp. ctMYd37 TaxID=2826260 RepID=A0A8S5M489_9CAUD|nr:MAG TPA: tail protein [Siphoviridae sp. ctMYd37]